MLTDDGMVGDKPGAILAKWAKIRHDVGVISKEKKNGMKFATLSSENVIDKVRDAANDEGVLIYPYSTVGHALLCEDGTLCDVNVTFRVQAIEDGSYITIAGFGEGADSQDKAGGKAGTYAMKAALVQALLAAGSKARGGLKAPDTDDTDEPIPGGVKAKTGKPKAPTNEAVLALFEDAGDNDAYAYALAQVRLMTPENQVSLRPAIIAAKARITSAVG